MRRCFGTDPESLGALVGADVEPGVEPHRAHLAPVPAPVGRDRLEASVEVEIANQQSLHSRVRVVGPHRRRQLRGAVLVQHLVGLDVDAPRMSAGPHGPERLGAENRVAPAHVPFGLEDPDLRIGDRADQVEGLVLAAPDVHHHFVAHRQDGADAGFHGEVQLDGIPDDGEPRDPDHRLLPVGGGSESHPWGAAGASVASRPRATGRARGCARRSGRG